MWERSFPRSHQTKETQCYTYSFTYLPHQCEYGHFQQYSSNRGHQEWAEHIVLMWQIYIRLPHSLPKDRMEAYQEYLRGKAARLALSVPGSASDAGMAPSIVCGSLVSWGGAENFFPRLVRALAIAEWSVGRFAIWWNTFLLRIIVYTKLELPGKRVSDSQGHSQHRYWSPIYDTGSANLCLISKASYLLKRNVDVVMKVYSWWQSKC